MLEPEEGVVVSVREELLGKGWPWSGESARRRMGHKG